MLKTQIKCIYRAFYHLRRIARNRRYLNRSSMTQLVHGLAISQLDYANALYVELPATLLDRLQRIQNAAVRLIFRLKKRDHVTPIMKKLHWLPDRQRIEYKVLVLTASIIYNISASIILLPPPI